MRLSSIFEYTIVISGVPKHTSQTGEGVSVIVIDLQLGHQTSLGFRLVGLEWNVVIDADSSEFTYFLLM